MRFSDRFKAQKAMVPTGFHFMKEVTLWHYPTSRDGQRIRRPQRAALPAEQRTSPKKSRRLAERQTSPQPVEAHAVQATNRPRLRQPAERRTSPQLVEAHAVHLTNKPAEGRNIFYLSQ